LKSFPDIVWYVVVLRYWQWSKHQLAVISHFNNYVLHLHLHLHILKHLDGHAHRICHHLRSVRSFTVSSWYFSGSAITWPKGSDISKDSTVKVKAKDIVKEKCKVWWSNMTIIILEFASCTANVYPWKSRWQHYWALSIEILSCRPTYRIVIVNHTPCCSLACYYS